MPWIDLRKHLLMAVFIVASFCGSADSRADTPAPMARTTALPGDGWWASFASPSLSSLIERALSANFDVEVRRLRLAEARLDPSVPGGWLWPLRVGVQGSLQQYRDNFANVDPNNPNSGVFQNTGGTFPQADLSAGVTYDLDFAGRRAALRRAAGKREQALLDSGEAFAVAVAAEVAETWFALLEERSQRALLARQLAEGDGFLALVQARVDQQLASRLDLLQQRLQLAATKALVPGVEARQRQLENRLAALLGRERGQADLPADTALPPLPPPPPGVAAEVIARRPDVRAAEVRLLEVEDRRRAQIATWAPSVQLFARRGWKTYSLSNFGDSTIWGYGATLSWPLFDGGQRLDEASRLEVESRRLGVERSELLLRAAREVDDAFAEEEKTFAFLGALRDQLEIGRAALAEAKVRYERGLGDYTPVLTTLRIVGDLERAQLTAQGQLLAVRVRLHEVLAGSSPVADGK
jgi:multidrug efflux system outer membrane protein